MKSWNWLSNEQYLYMTSQNSLYRDKWTKSQKKDFEDKKDWTSTRKAQMRKETEEKVFKSWQTLYLVLESNTLTQQQKDVLFDHPRVKEMLKKLVSSDDTSPLSTQTNKQSIARDMINSGLDYFQSRYGNEEYVKTELDKLKKLLVHLDYQWKIKEQEDKQLEFYRLRKQMKNPPYIGDKANDNALCIHCYAYASGMNIKIAIKNIRHDKNCSYNKSNKDFRDEQFIKKYPKKK